MHKVMLSTITPEHSNMPAREDTLCLRVNHASDSHLTVLNLATFAMQRDMSQFKFDAT